MHTVSVGGSVGLGMSNPFQLGALISAPEFKSDRPWFARPIRKFIRRYLGFGINTCCCCCSSICVFINVTKSIYRINFDQQ